MSSPDTTQPSRELCRILMWRIRSHALQAVSQGIWYGAREKACCPLWPPIYIAVRCIPERGASGRYVVWCVPS